MRIAIIIAIGFFVMAGSLTSCHYNPVVMCDSCTPDSTSHDFTWQQYSVPGESSVTGCWVFGPNDIYVVGTYNVYHFDGNSFVSLDLHYRDKPTIHVGTADFNLFAFSKTDFWMVSGSIALHCIDGKYVEDIRPGPVNACWGTSSSDIFIVGNSGHIAHYDGTNFTDMTSNSTIDLGSVWGTSHNNVWACGFNYSTGETIIVHYDGNSWTVDNLSNDAVAKTSGLDVVWACDSANTGHRFVATSGAYVYRKTDNGIWRNDIGLIPNALGGNTFVGLDLIGGNSPNDIMAAGGWGWVGHWNGKTWKKYDALYDYNNVDYNSRALSMNGNTACVVGTKGGASWVAVGQRKQ